VWLALCWEWPAVSLPCPPIGYKGIVFHQSRAVIFTAHLLKFLLLVLKYLQDKKSDRNLIVERSCCFIFFCFICFKLFFLWWKADILLGWIQASGRILIKS
jgi:hypothetical protein